MEVLINSEFNEDELKQLSKELGIKTSKYETKGVDFGEIVRVVFRDFDAFILLRDGLLFSTLSGLTKKAFEFIKKRKKEATIQSAVMLNFKDNEKEIAVNIRNLSDKDEYWRKIESTLTLELIDKAKNNQIIEIFWNEEEKEPKIIKM